MCRVFVTEVIVRTMADELNMFTVPTTALPTAVPVYNTWDTRGYVSLVFPGHDSRLLRQRTMFMR